ncbi:MAG: tyrosine-type recombinase/integrase [Bacteroidota bacterium]
MELPAKRTKKTFVLNDKGGDISKRWFIETYARGKRQRFAEGINKYSTIQERRQAAVRLIARLQKELRQETKNKNVYELITAYERWAPTVKKSSRQSYKTKLDTLRKWLRGRKITPALMQDFFADYAKTHAKSTTYDTFIMLQLFFKKAGMQKMLDGLSIKNGESKPLKYFQSHQQKQLSEYMRGHDPETWLYCQFVYYCFLRPRAELRFLKVGDIFFDEQKIRVPGEHAKNNKTQFVKIPRQFAPHLEHLKQRGPNEYIFPGRYSKEQPIGRNTIGRKFRAILDKFDYGSDYGVYSWKHTGVVNCANAGVPMPKLMQQLRHHSLDQTYQYMRQLGIEDMEDLAELFPAIGTGKKSQSKATYFLMNDSGLIIKLPSMEEAKRYIFEESVKVFKTVFSKGEIEAVALRPN